MRCACCTYARQCRSPGWQVQVSTHSAVPSAPPPSPRGDNLDVHQSPVIARRSQPSPGNEFFLRESVCLSAGVPLPCPLPLPAQCHPSCLFFPNLEVKGRAAERIKSSNTRPAPGNMICYEHTLIYHTAVENTYSYRLILYIYTYKGLTSFLAADAYQSSGSLCLTLLIYLFCLDSFPCSVVSLSSLSLLFSRAKAFFVFFPPLLESGS